ncbi:unnamed protein product, partial [Mesorhabditis belari]|uniref:Hexosyltransferase n=1 Tax=Mesorhabditis belari TaxID=2138241 RepID=A0AAF3ERM9_9BILA
MFVLRLGTFLLTFISILITTKAEEISENAGNETITHPYYRRFPFTIVPKDLCLPTVKTLFVVHTTIINQGRRALIRETYAHSRWENKYISWMRYLQENCKDVELIVKLDDDVVGNIFWLFDDIKQGKISRNRTFTCLQGMKLDLIRDKSSPWYVSKEAHPSERWEDCCIGPALFQSNDLCQELIQQAETHQYYNSVDDGFFTGTIAKEIRANHNFKLYGTNFLELEENQTEAHLLDRTHLFGLYSTSASVRRIFTELKYLYREEVDQIDDFPKSIKVGPIGEDEMR